MIVECLFVRQVILSFVVCVQGPVRFQDFLLQLAVYHLIM